MRAADLITILSRLRLPLADEKRTQAAIDEELQRQGIVFEREARLSADDVPDFLVGRTVIEVKIKGTKRNIYRQVERYAQHDCVGELILATNVPMGMPAQIHGKPVHMLNIARVWL